MRSLLAVVLLAALGCGGAAPAPAAPAAPSQAVQPTRAAEHAEMLELMERFLAAPLQAEDAPPRIVRFVAESPDVTVVIEPELAGFIGENIDGRTKHLLLTAVLAGNAASQLRSGKKGDDARAGALATVKVYALLKAHGASSPHMDRLLELQGKGELDAHITQMLAARKQP